MDGLAVLAFMVGSWMLLETLHCLGLRHHTQHSLIAAPCEMTVVEPALQHWLLAHPAPIQTLSPGPHTSFDVRHNAITIHPVSTVTYLTLLEFLHEWIHARQSRTYQRTLIRTRIPLAFLVVICFFSHHLDLIIGASLISLGWIGQHARLEIQADTVAWHTLFFIVPDLPPSRWMTQRSWLHLSDALLMAFIPYAIAGWGLAIFWARLG